MHLDIGEGLRGLYTEFGLEMMELEGEKAGSNDAQPQHVGDLGGPNSTKCFLEQIGHQLPEENSCNNNILAPYW